MRKLKLREVKQLAQGHTANKRARLRTQVVSAILENTMPGVWLPWASLGLSFPLCTMGETGVMRLCKLPWGKSLTHVRLGRYGLQPPLKPVWDVIYPTPLSPQHTHPHSGGSVGGGSMATEHGNRAARLHGAQRADLSWSPGCPLSCKVTSLAHWQAATGPGFQETDDPEPSKVVFGFPDLSPLRSLTLRTAVRSLTRS